MAWITAAVCLVLVPYLFAVRLLRLRRLHAAQAKYRELKQAGKELDPSSAQEIVHTAILYDMPYVTRMSAQAALFKTYGIPSIAELLLKTGELASAKAMSKRVTDSAIMISSFISCPLSGKTPTGGSGSDPRGCLATARMNWLHRHYRISNDDMLYTLAEFIIQPINLCEKLEWRPFSPEEKESNFILWKEIGRRMGIEDIPDTLEELITWSNDYEEQHMAPSEDANKMAVTALENLQRRVPNIPGLRYLVCQVYIALLDEKLRTAMILEAPPRWVNTFIIVVCGIRSFVMKHCTLPRRKPHGYIAVHDPPTGYGEDGKLRLHTLVRQHYPWYYPVSKDGETLLVRIKKYIFGDSRINPSPEFRSGGYRIEELGPLRYEKAGHSDVFLNAEALYGGHIGFPWGPQPNSK